MILRFADCELDLRRHELRVAGDLRHVEPQVFDLIALLARAEGRLVARDELVDAVWEGRIVSESAISARINAARRALGDDGARQAIIATVPRRGLRLAAPVERLGPETPPETAALPETPAAALDAPSAPPGFQAVRFARSADGARIAWAESGGGPGAPLLRAGHFLTHLERDWRSEVWAPLLERLGAGRRLVRYDQRSTGLSDRDPPGIDLEACVADLAAVAEASGLERFDLLGISQGAPVSVAFAARHPEQVRRLAIWGGYARGRSLRDDPEERARGDAMQALIRHSWGQTDSPFLRAFATYFAPGATPAQLDDLTAMQAASAGAPQAARLREAIDRFDVADRLCAVRAPTLVVHVSQDGVQPHEEGRRLAEGIPGAAFLSIESRSHVPLPGDPNWAALDAILAFLDAP